MKYLELVCQLGPGTSRNSEWILPSSVASPTAFHVQTMVSWFHGIKPMISESGKVCYKTRPPSIQWPGY